MEDYGHRGFYKTDSVESLGLANPRTGLLTTSAHFKLPAIPHMRKQSNRLAEPLKKERMFAEAVNKPRRDHVPREVLTRRRITKEIRNVSNTLA